LFVTQYFLVGDYYKTQVLVKKLSREEICQHLNTLDQIGYLDYDSSNYTFVGDEPDSIGGPSINIVANAWRSKSDRYYDLGYYLRDDVIQESYGQKGYPIISPALRDAYYFLHEYPTDGFEVYRPDRLGVWISPVKEIFINTLGVQVENWKFKKMSLIVSINNAEFLSDNDYQKFIILNGRDAQLLYDYFGNLIGTDYFFIEDSKGGKNYYEVLVRPLLPYEKPGEYSTGYMSTIPAPDAPKPNFKLTCYPSDGTLPIPTP